MPVSEAQKKAITNYDAKTYDRFLVRVKRGEKSVMEKAARTSPEGSLNGYVVSAVKQRMERDKRSLTTENPEVDEAEHAKATSYKDASAAARGEAQDDTIDEQLAAMDEFIAAISASDEDVPEFERVKLREVEV